jgi:hypothetical protein
VGADVKSVRHYRSISQGIRYDPQADFVCQWIPELAVLRRRVHLLLSTPDRLTTSKVCQEKGREEGEERGGVAAIAAASLGGESATANVQVLESVAAVATIKERGAQLVHSLPLALQSMRSGPNTHEKSSENVSRSEQEQLKGAIPAWASDLGEILSTLQMPISSPWTCPAVDPCTLVTWQMLSAASLSDTSSGGGQ